MRLPLRCLLFSLVCLCSTAADLPWRGELDAAELYSDRSLIEARAQLDVLRAQYQAQHQSEALAYLKAIDCFLLINTEPNKAAGFAQAALAEFKPGTQSEAAVRLTTCRGAAHEQTGDLAGARRDYQAGIDLGRQGGYLLAQTEAMGYLADLISYQGNMAEALSLVRAGIALLEKQADMAGKPVLLRSRRNLLGRMANIYLRMDEPAKAAVYYEQVLAEDEQLGNRQALISDAYNLGRSYEEIGDLARGLEVQRKSLALAQSLDDKLSIAWCQRAIGAMLAKQEKYREAEPVLNAALTAFIGFDDEEMVAQLRYFLAKVKAQAGNDAAAEQLLAQAIATFSKNDNLRYLDWALLDHARLRARHGAFEQAYQALQRRTEVHAKLEKEIQSKTAARLRVEFDTDKMERQNRQLLAEQKWQQDKLRDSRKIERLQYVAIVLGGLLMALLAYFAVRQLRATQRLRTIAMTDELTGIANRRSIYAWAEQQWAQTRDQGAPFCLILIDIDFFKQINDQFGHPMGDHVLKQVARCAKEQLRQADRIGRVGGEEFMVILPGAHEIAAAEVAERLRLAVQNLPTGSWAEGLKVSISLGIAVRSSAAETLPAMVQRADIALYAAKQGGRNRVEIAA